MDPKITKNNFKEFNEHWDSLCSFDYKEIESQNSHLDDSLYPHLGPAALYTSFADYHQLLEFLPKTVKHIIDLGAGVGRIAPIWKSLVPDGEVTLVELVESRHKASVQMIKNLNLNSVNALQQDLLSFDLPSAGAYFIYLPVSSVLERIIDEISLKGKECYVIAIESHGNLYDRFQSWKGLELLDKKELYSQRHNPFGHIYKYTPADKEKDVFSHALSSSYQDKVITIKEKNGEWIGSSFDLVWSSKDEILLKCPPRSVKKDSLQSVKDLSEFSSHIQSLLKIMKQDKEYEGSLIRKIWITPNLRLEMQNGKVISLPSSSQESLDQ